MVIVEMPCHVPGMHHVSALDLSSRVLHVCADRFASDGDKNGADAALYAADRAHKHCQTEDAMLDAMEAAEAQYDARKQPGDAIAPRSLGHLAYPQFIRL